ncbi:MAG: hypothetical protein ABI419_03350 [Ginsengibacter sp.]
MKKHYAAYALTDNKILIDKFICDKRTGIISFNNRESWNDAF